MRLSISSHFLIFALPNGPILSGPQRWSSLRKWRRIRVRERRNSMIRRRNHLHRVRWTSRILRNSCCRTPPRKTVARRTPLWIAVRRQNEKAKCGAFPMPRRRSLTSKRHKQAETEPFMPDSADGSLVAEIERQTHEQEANTSLLVRLYTEKFQENPLTRLIQDLQQRAALYSNALEEIKRLIPPIINSGADFVQIDTAKLDDMATAVKLKYEAFGLIKAGNLPNPTAATICDYIMVKVSRISRLLLDVLAKYATEIGAELRIEPETTMTFEVGIGLPPDITIGIERSAKRATHAD